MAIQLHDSLMMHPGPWLREEVLKHFRLSVTDAAGHLKVSRPALSNLLNGNAALSPEMAIRFEKAFGVSARTMLNMQANCDLAKANALAETLDVERWDTAA